MFVELSNKVDEGSPCGKNGNEACFGGICSREPPKVRVSHRLYSDSDKAPYRMSQKIFAPFERLL